MDACGVTVPMLEVPPTPPATLSRAREIARGHGVRHVYTGNVRDAAGQSTYCAGCGAVVIERNQYELGAWRLTPEGDCAACGTRPAAPINQLHAQQARTGGGLKPFCWRICCIWVDQLDVPNFSKKCWSGRPRWRCSS